MCEAVHNGRLAGGYRPKSRRTQYRTGCRLRSSSACLRRRYAACLHAAEQYIASRRFPSMSAPHSVHRRFVGIACYGSLPLLLPFVTDNGTIPSDEKQGTGLDSSGSPQRRSGQLARRPCRAAGPRGQQDAERRTAGASTRVHMRLHHLSTLVGCTEVGTTH